MEIFKDEEPWPPCLDGRGRGGCADQKVCAKTGFHWANRARRGFTFTLRQMSEEWLMRL